jgi:hypothetical protein
MKLQVLLDGEKAGKLVHGKEISLTVDEGEHQITGDGGLFAKSFRFQLDIPSGKCSYCFQTDILSVRNGYLPIIRPSDGQRLKDDVTVRSVMGSEITRLLLNEKVRATLTADTVIQVNLSEDKWQVTAAENGQVRVLLEQGYSSTDATGSLILSVIASALDSVAYSTPEQRQETLKNLFDNYLRYLPDYEITSGSTLRFKG